MMFDGKWERRENYYKTRLMEEIQTDREIPISRNIKVKIQQLY
jgi:hypothetical protein